MKDASKYRANRIIFDSDSDDDGEAADDVTRSVQPAQSDKQVRIFSANQFYLFIFFVNFLLSLDLMWLLVGFEYMLVSL